MNTYQMDFENCITPSLEPLFTIELRPISLDAWADKFRVLSSEASAEVGKWYTSRAEYQRGIMRAVSDATVQRVVVMSSAQIGKTEVILNALGYYADYEPAPSMVMQPTLEMARAFSVDRFAPMVRDCDRLARKVVSFGAKSGESTILHRSFIGGHVTFVGANSPAGLSGRPIRFLAADEVDRFPASAGSEGNPLDLATKRTTTYFNAKILITSTPTVKGASVIEREFESGTQERYHVPCPHCGAMQELKWHGIRWEKTPAGEALPATAWYECGHCQARIEHSSKLSMVAAGGWVAEFPERRTVRSFHISELYSPWSTWSKMVSDFLKAKRDTESLRVFINTSLGESWDDTENLQISEEALQDSVEDYDGVPAGGLVLTAGVDVQDTYMVADVWAWGNNEEAWLIDRKQILGTPASGETWEQLSRFLQTSYTAEDSGADMSIVATCVDSGGHFTEEVYRFCKENDGRRVWAIKGMAGMGHPIVSKFSLRGKVRAKLFSIGVDSAKELLYSRLAQGGRIHLRKEVADGEWLREFTAEKQVKKFIRGHAKMQWQKIRARNEALDTAVYALAAMRLLNPAWQQIHEKRQREKKPIGDGSISSEGVQNDGATEQEKTVKAEEQHTEAPKEQEKKRPNSPIDYASQAYFRRIKRGT